MLASVTWIPGLPERSLSLMLVFPFWNLCNHLQTDAIETAEDPLISHSSFRICLLESLKHRGL